MPSENWSQRHWVFPPGIGMQCWEFLSYTPSEYEIVSVAWKREGCRLSQREGMDYPSHGHPIVHCLRGIRLVWNCRHTTLLAWNVRVFPSFSFLDSGWQKSLPTLPLHLHCSHLFSLSSSLPFSSVCFGKDNGCIRAPRLLFVGLGLRRKYRLLGFRLIISILQEVLWETPSSSGLSTNSVLQCF